MATQDAEQSVKEIWALFRETDARLKKMFQEIMASFQETDARFKQTDARLEKMFQETRADFKDTDAKFKETAAGFKEVEARFKDTDKKIKELTNLFTGQWGKLIESLAESGIMKIMQSRGINVTHLSRRLESHKNGHHMELDFLLSNEKELVIGEVKTTMGVDDVKHFLKKLEELFLFYPGYKRYKIYGAMIGVRIDEGVDLFAYRRGLFVLKVGGEGMLKLLNDTDFKPKDFSSEIKMKV